MTKTYLTISVLSAAGALSMCDLSSSTLRRPDLFGVAAAHAATIPEPLTRRVPAEPGTVTLHVEGMTCGGCVLSVRKVLERIPGVQKVDVSYEKRRAVVTYDSEKVTIEQLIDAIKTLKYKATVVPA